MAELKLGIEEKEEQKLQSLTTDIVVASDVSEEFSLPDYVSEIRKLLCVRAQVLPESKFISDSGNSSNLEFGGTVTYLVIYTDDEGSLCALPLTSNYEANTTLASHPTTVIINTEVDSVQPRVNAPRKLTIKTRLKSRIMGWEENEEKERIEGKSTADEMFMERNITEEKALGIRQISMQNIKASGSFDTQGEARLQPIWCDAKIITSDVRVQNNSVSVRGEITIKCICKSQEGIVTLTKTEMLAEEMEAQGAMIGDMARVSGRCVSLAISNEQSGDSEKLFYDLTSELEGELIRNTEVALTRDCYSTKNETDEQYKIIDLYSCIKAQNTSFTINESVKRKNNEINEIVDIICDPVCEKADFKNGKAILSGKLNLTVIGKKENDEEIEYLSENYEIPYKYACDTGKLMGDLIATWDVSLGNLNARYEGEKLLVNAEIYPSYEIMEKQKCQILDTLVINKDKEIKKEASCVRVYFPKEGDTLWEIAKKYHTTVVALKEKNNLNESSLNGVKSVIV